LMAASATFALRPGVWFRRGRLLMVSPGSMGTACPLSGRNSTYRPVQILEAGSVFPSTQYSKDTKTGEQRGLALAITRALTSRLGITEVSTVEHPNPVAVVACVKAGECDLGFVSIEPARLAEVDFTPPYIRRDFTYLVPANSSVRGVDDADRPGIRIATVTGHASRTALVRVLKQAKPVYADDLDPAFEFTCGRRGRFRLRSRGGTEVCCSPARLTRAG
jgi:ABC-type amino acid transport substrate-binding protein